MDETANTHDRIVTLTADIISAYVSSNHLQSAELSKLIADVYGALSEMTQGKKALPEPSHPKATPAEIRRSITHDYLTSFEDGKSYKTLRRHLTLRGLTPEAYRQKWGLPHDYPMTSASYSEQRSELARSLGLGQQRRRSVARAEDDVANDAPEPVTAPAPEPEVAAMSEPEAPSEGKPRRGRRGG
ncbi:MucR family transcriptional regulator [Methylobacterium nonmethylotrophicum]|uniref:MucR family transcriptional regulator n=1 Tax=Methylobacterium nonmethylotrophicum TaxID=1141884 RepID=A0A4Z0NLU6_9HYPH|nr:MucR family transcriptional regulator [Methylobacterium nonmethylotrophicum]TGD97456.1 MucR family transcriptional regulator [Methylobacterium nonmethylotrophicum]